MEKTFLEIFFLLLFFNQIFFLEFSFFIENCLLLSLSEERYFKYFFPFSFVVI